MPETRTRYHYHPRKRQRTLADCGVAVAKQEAGLNDTSSDLVTRGKERRIPDRTIIREPKRCPSLEVTGDCEKVLANEKVRL